MVSVAANGELHAATTPRFRRPGRLPKFVSGSVGHHGHLGNAHDTGTIPGGTGANPCEFQRSDLSDQVIPPNSGSLKSSFGRAENAVTKIFGILNTPPLESDLPAMSARPGKVDPCQRVVVVEITHAS